MGPFKFKLIETMEQLSYIGKRLRHCDIKSALFLCSTVQEIAISKIIAGLNEKFSENSTGHFVSAEHQRAFALGIKSIYVDGVTFNFMTHSKMNNPDADIHYVGIPESEIGIIAYDG